MPEPLLLAGTTLLHASAAAWVWRPRAAAPRLLPRGWLEAAVALHTLALAWRWQSMGHGPFTTLHEILSSSLWSLSLVYGLAMAAVPELRRSYHLAVPVLLLLAVWAWLADRGPGHLPPTYDTPLLYLHAVVGKAYLGLLLVATALGLTPWLRGTRAADAQRLDRLSHRFAAWALVCDTAMLIVGAVWAQDAWGRWWAWDPLESWAFVSWLALAGTLHARATWRPRPGLHGLWLASCFVLAFLTFFGVPFLSTAPHKGAI